MTQQLINQIKDMESKKLVYNTACLKVTASNNYASVYQRLLAFVSKTVEEPGCIAFFVVPSNLEKKELMLWEVWETPEAFNQHMEEAHTKEILSQKIIELKWNDFVAGF